MSKENLEKFLAPHGQLYSDTLINAATGDLIIYVSKGRKVRMNPAGAAEIKGMVGAFDGEIMTFHFQNNNTDVSAQVSDNAMRIFLPGNVDQSGVIHTAILMQWDRAGTKWVKIV